MKKRKSAIAAVVVTLAVGVGWAMGFFEKTDPQVAELQQLRDENISKMDQMPAEQRREQWRGLRDRVEQLSPEQRQQFFDSSRDQFQAMMLNRVDRFFALPPEEQQEKLDEMIDRMENWRKQREANGGDGRRGGNRGNLTSQQRDQRSKERLDRTTPELRAKFDRFRDMINERREERGLEPMNGFRGMFRGGRG